MPGFSIIFRIPFNGFRISGAAFQSLSVELGIWIPILSALTDSLSCILDSEALDSRLHKQNLPGYQILLQGAMDSKYKIPTVPFLGN